MHSLRRAKAKGAPLKGQRVSAWPTRRRLHVLLHEGFTRGSLALRLGLKRPRLEWHPTQVTIATEQRLQTFYEAIMAEGPEQPEARC